MTPPIPSTDRILDAAKAALRTEIAGMEGLIPRLGEPFAQAARKMLTCTGKVVVTGMGKSGHVGAKIAATLASTGTPAFFMHPAEAIHGDLGMITRSDIILAISNSGNTEEVVRLLPPLRRMGVTLIAMTGNPASTLAKGAEIHLDASVAKEACPLGLAPTASTTAALALGDALAVALLDLRNFKEEDFALFHPGGSLGKQLVTTVGDLMDSGEKLPCVTQDALLTDIIPEILAKQYGMTAVQDAEGRLAGLVSLGDLTRMHLKDPSLAFLGQPVSQVMTRNPKTITPDALAARALNTMETLKIRALIVVDAQNRPVGIIGLYEVLRAIDY
ncbi:MAG: KpsF/GutQ family sugar-phosphate isomerase [Deltaproteobacteria bacterium]|nr:KpsF/GutQ family sugar-phosphate isomerase [Deltaproteobacteria bacterium]